MTPGVQAKELINRLQGVLISMVEASSSCNDMEPKFLAQVGLSEQMLS